MSNITTYLEEAVLDHVFRNQEFARPGATFYVALLSSDSAEVEMESGTDVGNAFGEEIAGYTGVRREVTFDWAIPRQQAGKATLVNAADIEFTGMPAPGLRKIKYAGICTSSVIGANFMLYWCPLSVEKEWGAGDTFKIPAGDLIIDLD